MTDVRVLDDLEAISQEAARRWLDIARKAVEERGNFSIALSGGNTPKRLYQLMASTPFKDQAPWAQTYVFWGDERRVPPGHEQSDYRMARETLLDLIPVPHDHIFRMLGEGLASTAVKDYEDKLQRYFGLEEREWPLESGPREWPQFDLVLLGLGADGHTASMFPGTRAVSDVTHMVVVFEVPKLNAERITLTRRVFNNARNILFLVSGADKAAALANTLEGPDQPSKYPARVIQPENGTLTWLVDKAAAASLKSVGAKSGSTAR